MNLLLGYYETLEGYAYLRILGEVRRWAEIICDLGVGPCLVDLVKVMELDVML